MHEMAPLDQKAKDWLKELRAMVARVPQSLKLRPVEVQDYGFFVTLDKDLCTCVHSVTFSHTMEGSVDGYIHKDDEFQRIQHGGKVGFVLRVEEMLSWLEELDGDLSTGAQIQKDLKDEKDRLFGKPSESVSA